MTTLDSFILLTDSLLEFETEISDATLAASSVAAMEVHKDEMKSTWSGVKSAYETCLKQLATARDGKSGCDYEVETVKSRYQSCYQCYVRCISRLTESIQQISSSHNSRMQESLPSHNFHLPPCDTEVFSGDYLMWPSFRDMFTAIYVNNTRLSPVEKLYHLNSKTRGEARDIVKKSPLTNDGFSSAWQNLRDRFENKRILVNSQLKILFNLSSIATESGQAIKKLQRDINSCISTLQLYNIKIDDWDCIFVFICSTRLPDNTLALWEQSIINKTEIPKWQDFDDFLTSRYQTLETVSDIRNSSFSKHPIKKPSVNSNILHQTRKVNTYHSNVSGPFCKLCPKEQHPIRQCDRFLKLNIDDRMSHIKKYGLCINCFARGHAVKDCKSTHNCYTCNKRHNSLLHRNIPQASSSLSVHISNNPNISDSNSSTGGRQSHATLIQSTDTPSCSNNIQTCFASNCKGILLGTAMVHIRHFGTTYTARALIDSGSEGTFISERLFKLLKLPSTTIQAKISGLNNTTSAKVEKLCSLILSSPINTNINIEATALVLPKLTGNLPTCPIDPSILDSIPNIMLADSQFFKSSHVDILIGGDLLPFILLEGIKHNICGSLLGQETVFGWILTGPISSNSISSFSTRVSYLGEVALDKALSRFWEVEDLPQKQFLTKSEQFCEEKYVQTTKRNSEGRYVVQLPFKEGYPDTLKLGHSRSIAHAQFLKNEARLCKDPRFKLEYDSVVSEYLELGHMHLVQPPKYECVPDHYYLPHHAVINPDSTTTKVRVVFNASSPSSNGTSLNEVLYPGPVLQSDLTLLLLKWRFYKFVFNSDLQKMYRQILIDPCHRPFQRILFRDSQSKHVCDFELQTVTFGVNCAPFLAIRTLLQLADDVEKIYPLASNILRNCMYVDDVLAGAHDIDSGLKSRDELISALSSAGFSLRKWTSNSKSILAGVPREHLLNGDFLRFEDCSTATTLGVRWHASLDSFHFSTEILHFKSTFTKREVLSQISKLFDPAGWLAPCIVTAKILMQEIWLEKINWDDDLPPSCLKKWHTFLLNFPHINKIQIPRWICYSPECSIQFHSFCDASEKAYAATLYVRINLQGSISTHLLAAKTRVAPVKTISIPRLELCGAVLLAEMIDALVPQLGARNYESFHWTDSTIVLAWLSKPPCQWSTFVANRVSKIVQSIGQSNWFHVDTRTNPADLASRGLPPQELIQNDLWWYGPEWLRLSSSHWPSLDSTLNFETNLEQKAIKSHFVYFKDYEDILDRFSEFSKAIRVIAYLYRFYYRTHPKHRSEFSFESQLVTASEVIDVKARITILCQKVVYSKEYHNLSKKESIASSSTILNLYPFLDSKGLLRVGGRLASSPSLSYDERHPIILPYNCQLSRLLIRFIHQLSLHGGNQLMLRLVRSQFWIPKVKNLIKTAIHHCKTCVVYKQRLQTQLMGSLPPERTVLTRPFANTDLDFAGPFEIKNYTGRACLITKGYVCVFICFATKAIHLEGTSNLSTDAFLAAFHRFVSRRGCPLNLYSDNGTTFVGASKKLTKDFLLVSRSALVAHYTHQNISWHFNPPGAPHMGGLWEAGVKSFKMHFRKVAGSFKYTFEELATLLSRIEACLNSRPISPISEDPADISALTPGHFLVGGLILAPLDPDIQEPTTLILNRWQRLKALQQHFCARWKNEYLTELQKRHKWKKSSENLKENTMVVIKEDNLPPNEWRLGRVSKVYLGDDNRVGVADVITERGLIKRPIVKLVVLPVQ